MPATDRHYIHGDPVEGKPGLYFCLRCDSFEPKEHFVVCDLGDVYLHGAWYEDTHERRYLEHRQKWLGHDSGEPQTRHGMRIEDDPGNLFRTGTVREQRRPILKVSGTREKTTQDAIETIMSRYPFLNYWGMGLEGAQKPKPTDPKLVAARNTMRSHLGPAEFNTSVGYLQLLERTSTPNPRAHSSYTHKHLAENWGAKNNMSWYVSNGMLIAAALHLGFKFACIRETPYRGRVILNIAKGSIPRDLGWQI